MASARLRIVRRSPSPGMPRRVGASVTAVAALVLVSAVSAPALAAGSGSVQATVNVAPSPVKSVTLSTNTLTFNSCVTSSGTVGTQLGFPNGRCGTGPVTVSEGTAPTIVALGVSPFSPVDGGTPWTLENQSATPGPDQFLETLVVPGSTGNPATPAVLGTLGTDPILNPGNVATAGQSASEVFGLIGPQTSTDPSPQFTQTLTWTAT